jgi:ornithine cyclodeaminase
MTRFVDVPAMAKLIQAIEVDEFIAELTDVIEANFVRWEEFDKAARFGAHNDEGVIELMPTANAERYGFKYVNGHPENIKHDLFSVMGFGVLSDMNTGYPMLLSELTLATAMRTAATSVMAARALARKDSRVMAMIGNGAQAEFQAIGFHKVIGITEIRAFDIDPEATEKLARNLAEFEGIKVVHCNSVAEAVKGADIVTTITADKAMATIITADMVEPGMHFNGVGGDCPGKTELPQASLLRAKYSWNLNHRLASKATSSRCQLTSRSITYGKYWQAKKWVVTTTSKSRSLTPLALRSKISQPLSTFTSRVFSAELA